MADVTARRLIDPRTQAPADWAVRENTLSDGSHTYDVVSTAVRLDSQPHNPTVFECADFNAATTLETVLNDPGMVVGFHRGA